MGRVGMRSEERAHLREIGDIGLDEFERPLAGNLREPVALETDGVIIVEVVDADDFMPVTQEPSREMRSDEAGNAGEDDLHGAPPDALPAARIS